MGVRFIIPCDFELNNADMMLLQAIEDHYNYCLFIGRTPQQARYFLPNGLKTEIVMTCNLRQWRHFFKLRTANASHPQMRELTIPLLTELAHRLPVIFGDIKPTTEA